MHLVYYNHDNFGDILSPRLVEFLGKKTAEPADTLNADLYAVGSILNYFPMFLQEKGTLLWKLKKMYIFCRRCQLPVVRIWGSGFIKYPDNGDYVFFRRVHVHALRGKISLEILKTISTKHNPTYDSKMALGDPGLLFPMLFEEQVDKRYDIGVIAHKHDRELGHRLAGRLMNLGVRAVEIDIGSEPSLIMSTMRQCETIVSSSLHGLIVSDALGIPNMHLHGSDLGLGKDDYWLKFHDYYSAYTNVGSNLSMSFDEAELLGISLPARIREGYKVARQEVQEIQQRLLNCFPYQAD